jgi:polyferredoxin
MNKKISQPIMVWFLPIIVIAGLFLPLLGYLVFFMMIFFLTLSYFKGRFWCSYLCPRGAFLDLVLSRFSLKRRVPKSFSSSWLKWTIFSIFMLFFIFQFIISRRDLFSLGFLFVKTCILTTLIAIFLGVPMHERAWCAICPMGTLQAKLGRLRKNDIQTTIE